MTIEDPNGIRGKRESHVLEFKSQEILKAPAKIAREVVAFLNKEGGDVWIGYPEQNGIALAPEVIPDADRMLGALQNHLIDTIEPPVRIPDEIDIKVANAQIRVSVRKGQNGPYAQRDRGRHFWIRIGDRLREMSREEIAEGFRGQPKSEERFLKVVSDLRQAQQGAAKEAPRLWLRLVPSESLSIDFDDEENRKQFREWLMNPKATGNRPAGWNFANRYEYPKFLSDRVTQGDSDIRCTEIRSTGQVTFTMNRDTLNRKAIESERQNLSPYLLMEFPTSVLRLAAAILGRYQGGRANLKVVAGFLISGVREWSLRPGSPDEPLPWAGPKTFEQKVLEIDPERLVFDADRLTRKPDECGFQLVRLIYEAFGFDKDAIPPEFDQQQGILRLG